MSLRKREIGSCCACFPERIPQVLRHKASTCSWTAVPPYYRPITTYGEVARTSTATECESHRILGAVGKRLTEAPCSQTNWIPVEYNIGVMIAQNQDVQCKLARRTQSLGNELRARRAILQGRRDSRPAALIVQNRLSRVKLEGAPLCIPTSKQRL